ncbi:MAG: GNAT family N-acetyltransferase [Spirochaetales bacterium]
MWTQVDRTHLDSLLRFLGPHEAGCVAFTSQLRQDGEIAMPPRRLARIYARYERDRVTGALLQNLSGLYYPVLDPIHPTIEPELVQLCTRVTRRVYSVMGRQEDVLAFEASLARSPHQCLDYYLMVQHHVPPERPFPRVPRGFVVHTAKPDDVETLFSLQKQYEIEEVLLPGNTFHAASSRKHLESTLSSEIVLYGTLADRPIAKVATNARGIFYDQIGGVFTEPSFRSRGISSLLMTRLLEQIAKAGKSGTLFVKKDNASAIKMYTNLGFVREHDFRISYYG